MRSSHNHVERTDLIASRSRRREHTPVVPGRDAVHHCDLYHLQPYRRYDVDGHDSVVAGLRVRVEHTVPERRQCRIATGRGWCDERNRPVEARVGGAGVHDAPVAVPERQQRASAHGTQGKQTQHSSLTFIPPAQGTQGKQTQHSSLTCHRHLQIKGDWRWNGYQHRFHKWQCVPLRTTACVRPHVFTDRECTCAGRCWPTRVRILPATYSSGKLVMRARTKSAVSTDAGAALSRSMYTTSPATAAVVTSGPATRLRTTVTMPSSDSDRMLSTVGNIHPQAHTYIRGFNLISYSLSREKTHTHTREVPWSWPAWVRRGNRTERNSTLGTQASQPAISAGSDINNTATGPRAVAAEHDMS